MPTLVEEVIEEKGLELGGLLVGLGDVSKEDGLWRLCQRQAGRIRSENCGDTLMMQPPRHMRAIPA